MSYMKWTIFLQSTSPTSPGKSPRRTYYSQGGRVANSIVFQYLGKTVRFEIDEPSDVIQKVQASGSFYERRTLERLADIVPEGATIIDAGANVGNHSIFFSLFCKPMRIIPFEPNARLAAVLQKNIALNATANIDTSRTHFALGRSRGHARLVVRRADNWGNGHLVAEATDAGVTVFDERVEVRPIDEFKIEAADFIKIDVEGHEVEVLHGAIETITRFRPTLFIEVGAARLRAVAEFLAPLGYQAIDAFCQYRTQFNLLYMPVR